MKKTITLIVLALCFYNCLYASSMIKSLVDTSSKNSEQKFKKVDQDTSCNYEWFSTRVSCLYSDLNTELSFSAFMVIAMDSVIYLNINKFGMEIGRVTLSPGGVCVLLHTESECIKTNYENLYRRIGLHVDYKTIQNILTNGVYQRISVDSSMNIVYDCAEDSLEESKKNLADIFYDSLVITDSLCIFPKKIRILLPDEIKLELEYKSLKINVPGPIGLTVPEKYTIKEF